MGNGKPKSSGDHDVVQKNDVSQLSKMKEEVQLEVSKLTYDKSEVIFRLLSDDYELGDEDTDSYNKYSSSKDYGTLMRHFDSEKIKTNLIKVIFCVNTLLNKLPKKYAYHSKEHTTEQVLPRALTLGSQHGKVIGEKKMPGTPISEQDKELLFIAAICHDLGFLKTSIKNEPLGALYAELIMKKLGYKEKQITTVSNMILATDTSKVPKTLLESILRDADMAHLGDNFDLFLEKTHNLFDEYAACKIIEMKGRKKQDIYKEWMLKEPDFMNSHNYFSEIGHHMLHQRKIANTLAITKYLDKKFKE